MPVPPSLRTNHGHRCRSADTPDVSAPTPAGCAASGLRCPTEMTTGRTINLTINGKPYAVTAPNRRTLVDLIRYDLGLTGTKEACSVGVCGACTVLLDGRMVASCITLA